MGINAGDTVWNYLQIINEMISKINTYNKHPSLEDGILKKWQMGFLKKNHLNSFSTFVIQRITLMSFSNKENSN